MLSMVNNLVVGGHLLPTDYIETHGSCLTILSNTFIIPNRGVIFVTYWDNKPVIVVTGGVYGNFVFYATTTDGDHWSVIKPICLKDGFEELIGSTITPESVVNAAMITNSCNNFNRRSLLHVA